MSILNYKNAAVFHSLENCDSNFIMQELGKFNLKRNANTNGLENYISFSIKSKLRFIKSFQFISSLLDRLVKNLVKDDFNCLSQEFDHEVLDLGLIKKDFILMNVLAILISLKKNYQAKKVL